MKIPVISQLDIHSFSGSGIDEYEAGTTNVIPHEKNGTVRATQRPSIDISEDGSSISALNDRGRGIYYWEENSKLYIVHDNDVYSTTQNSTAIGTVSAGSERVQMLETIGTPRLVILDAENDEGWVTSIGETVTQIASNFPTTLAHGGQILNGSLHVMDEDGVVYSSDVNNPTTFPATNFINSERDNDKGVYLGKHHDHLPAFGTRTIEFFRWDQSATVGSPLIRRQDISYNIGCASGTAVWENGDKTYFVGSNPQGQLAIYKLEAFQARQISTDTFSSYLTQGITQNNLKIVLNGLSAMGNDILLMTVYILTGTAETIDPKVTLSYDVKHNLWGFWKTDINSHTTFPLMAWTKRTGGQNPTVSARTGEGILYNGDIISINDDLTPVDTILGNTGVYESGVYETDVYSGQTLNNGVNIPIILRTGLKDGEVDDYKFESKLSISMEKTKNPQTLTVKTSDEISDSFGTGNTIDTSLTRKELWQGGRYIKRNRQLEYSGDEQVFIENINTVEQVGV